MTDKILRFYGTARLDDDSQGSVVASFEMALADLATKAARDGREVLWGTIGMDVSRNPIDVTSLNGGPQTYAGPTFIGVDADCLKHGRGF